MTVTDRRTKVDFAYCIKDLLTVHYSEAERITIVMDNLNTHHPSSLYEAFEPAEAKALLARCDFHYTPKHDSWLNMADIEFSALQRQCLDRRIPDQETLREEIAVWENRRHKQAVKVNWRFTWAPGQSGRIPETLAPTIQGWVQGGPQSCGLDRANWTYDELATHLYQPTGIEVKRTAMRVFCQRHGLRPYRPTYRYLRGDPGQQQVARDELAALKKAQTGQCVLLSQDAARFPLVPTLCTTLGVKGHRPLVGTWDNKDRGNYSGLAIVAQQGR